MNYEEFKDVLIQELKRILSQDNVTITQDTIVKGNGTVMDSFAIRFPDSNIEPRFYFNQQYTLYERAYPVDWIASCVANEARKSMYELSNIEPITRENAEENLYCTLMNKDMNKEYLKNVPYESFQDLAIAPRYKVDIEGGSILVTNSICSHELQMTSDEVMEIAMRNTQKQEYTCNNMIEEISRLLESKNIPFDEREEALSIINTENYGLDLYVVTNTENVNGAVAMVCPNVMKKVSEQLGGDLFILPSSRHEVMVLKDDGTIDVDSLREIVREANRVSVTKEDLLSDNVYRYDSRTKKVTIADTETKTITDEIIPTKEKSHKLTH